jgi:divalent metal cation (Fe/Co/Zn/Cd) transporter
MGAVGLATGAISVDRLVDHRGAHPVIAGVALSAVSMIVLTALSLRKRRAARLIPSAALLADAWLSGIGAALAAVTVAGTAMLVAFRWWWTDPTAAAVLGASAFVVSAALSRGLRADPGSSPGASYMS